MTEKTTKGIETLAATLALARDAAHEAEKESLRASSSATQRNNELDEAQRAIDDWYKEQREDAPDGSHWVSERKRGK